MIDECLATRAAIVRRTVQLPVPGTGCRTSASPCRRCSTTRRECHGAICLFTDLTAVKDLEEQLRLKESLATVGELTAGIAHEFRNGLATIQGYSKLIDLDALPQPYRPLRRRHPRRNRVARAGGDQLPELRASGAADAVAGRSRAICERAAEEIRADARALGGDVEVRGEFGAVEGDEVLLRQAFSNLLRNALEACVGASLPPMSPSGRRWMSKPQVDVRDGQRQRSRHSARSPRARVPAVLYHEAQRHRARSRARAEDHRLSQRAHHRRFVRTGRRPTASHTSDHPVMQQPPHAPLSRL